MCDKGLPFAESISARPPPYREIISLLYVCTNVFTIPPSIRPAAAAGIALATRALLSATNAGAGAAGMGLSHCVVFCMWFK